MATIVLGVQWGDEGKGKLCDVLSSEAHICARATGGRNCGHTVMTNGQTYDFHMLPSGLLNEKATNLIGPGVVLHVPTFFSELEMLAAKGINNVEGRLKVSTRCALNLDLHAVADRCREESLGAKSIGTTGRGIGPAYSTKAERSNLIVAELYDDAVLEHKLRAMAEGFVQKFGRELPDYSVEDEIKALKISREKLLPYILDEVEFIDAAQEAGQKILIEGAQSALLDNTYGTYGYVTSTSTTTGGVLAGLNLNPRKIDTIIGVIKAYTTRVGSGPFPSEDFGDVGNTLQEVGHEFGVSTGRRRRCGWLDLVVAKYSHHVNHYDLLNLTKLDILDSFQEIKVAVAYKHPETGEVLKAFPASSELLGKVEVVYETLKGWNTPTTHTKKYEDLPAEARAYVKFIEDFVGVKVRWVGCGPKREDIVLKD